jgi:type II secretory pathway pseudopilin PulG
LWQRHRAKGSAEKGVGLVETLIAVGILGLALVALLSGVSAGSMAVSRNDERVTAENLARSQLEYVKSQAYQPPSSASYATVTPPVGDYSVSTAVDSLDADLDIEKITVTVTHDTKTVFVVEDYKVNR